MEGHVTWSVQCLRRCARMQALDSGGNFSEVAAAHGRRVQQEFENQLEQLVAWLQNNESEEAVSALMAEMDQWREADTGRRLDFSVAESAVINSGACSSPPETGTAELESATAPDGDSGGQDEEDDDVEVQVGLYLTANIYQHC